MMMKLMMFHVLVWKNNVSGINMDFQKQLDEEALKRLLETEKPEYDILPALAKIVQETIASELEKEVEDEGVSLEELEEDLERSVRQFRGLPIDIEQNNPITYSGGNAEETYISPVSGEAESFNEEKPAEFVMKDKSDEEEEQRRRVL